MMTYYDGNELIKIGKVITLELSFTKKRLKKIAVNTIQESRTMNKDNLCR